MRSVIILFITLLPVVVIGKDYFTAAVFEHRARANISDDKDPKEVIYANLQFYAKAVELAAENGADIIVFSEYGLMPYPGNRENMKKYSEHVPDPKRHVFNPCTSAEDDRFILTSMSCLARENNIYIVVNMLDYQPCPQECYSYQIQNCDVKCPDDNMLIYNTDVAFDREGKIVARYHKMHPYFELVNTPEVTEYTTFDTEFGRFGMVVCFDAVFQESYKLVRDYGIDTLIYPTYWFDDILPLNAVELQQSWALANGVNFLGSNAQSASSGSLGSGIYSKDTGALIYTYENDGESKLLLANVRIRGKKEIPNISSITIIRHDIVFPKLSETGGKFPRECYNNSVGPAKDFNDYRCFKSQTENYTLTKLSSPSGTIKSCQNGLCCTLKYSAEDMTEDFYLAARNGTNNVKNYYFWWEESCLLIRCDPFNNKDCVMHPSASKTIFKSFELKANFSPGTKIFATVSKDKHRLAPKKEWEHHTTNLETELKFKSRAKVPLLKAALVGRVYERDPPFVPWYQLTIPETFFM